MARTIRILPEQLANRIAAGEVVERPANAVKELLENAIDAGATEISLEIEGDGFRIVDDGCGMNRDECLLALERHATSKIARDEDLDAIETLGFRGEALPSIASVSRFRLQSRPAGAAAGTEVLIEGGELKHVRDAGLPPGTAVEVRDLFFNVPARRKFMKSAATETGHMRETFARLALAFPEIGFRLKVEGRLQADVPAGVTPRERASRLLGKEFAQQSVEFGRKSGSLGYGIAGLLGHPRDNRARPDEIYWFVNGRFIRDRSLNHALLSAYRQFMPHDRFPRAAVFLTLPPGEVDVNVHPTKQEVRFARARDLYGLVSSAVTESLEEWLRQSPNLAPAAGAYRPVERSLAGRAAEAPAYEPPPRAFQWDAQGALRRKETLAEMPGEAPDADAGFYGRLAFLGQALGTYLVCQGDDGIVLIDQHAAHERVTFNDMLQAYRAGKPPVQGLLVPQVIELPPAAAQSLVENQPLLGSIGFDVAAFGGASIAVHGVPAPLAGREVKRVLADVAQELQDLGRAEMAEQAVAERIIGCACHGSVRANQPLSAPEVRALLRRLDEIERAGNCPHGRPVVVTIGRAELERRFGRTQG